jgi:Domain of unknown function (DUF5069)
MHTRSALYRNDSVKEQLPRSPYDMVGGVIYFPRMLDKIRLHARGADIKSDWIQKPNLLSLQKPDRQFTRPRQQKP